MRDWVNVISRRITLLEKFPQIFMFCIALCLVDSITSGSNVTHQRQSTLIWNHGLVLIFEFRSATAKQCLAVCSCDFLNNSESFELFSRLFAPVVWSFKLLPLQTSACPEFASLYITCASVWSQPLKCVYLRVCVCSTSSRSLCLLFHERRGSSMWHRLRDTRVFGSVCASQPVCVCVL